MIYYWGKNYPQNTIKEETGIGADIISELCEYFRHIITNYVMN